jgi:hypothetical protein
MTEDAAGAPPTAESETEPEETFVFEVDSEKHAMCTVRAHDEDEARVFVIFGLSQQGFENCEDGQFKVCEAPAGTTADFDATKLPWPSEAPTGPEPADAKKVRGFVWYGRWKKLATDMKARGVVLTDRAKLLDLLDLVHGLMDEAHRFGSEAQSGYAAEAVTVAAWDVLNPKPVGPATPA